MGMHAYIWDVPGASDGKESTCNVEDLSSIPGLGRFPEQEMAIYSSILAWKSLWTEKPSRLQSWVAKSRTQLSNFTFTFHFHALEKEMTTHSSVLAWRISGTGQPGGLPSMGSHRVGHD